MRRILVNVQTSNMFSIGRCHVAAAAAFEICRNFFWLVQEITVRLADSITDMMLSLLYEKIHHDKT